MKRRLGNLDYVPGIKWNWYWWRDYQPVWCVGAIYRVWLHSGLSIVLWKEKKSLCEFFDILGRLPFGHNSSCIHLHLVSFLCEFFDSPWGFTSGTVFLHSLPWTVFCVSLISNGVFFLSKGFSSCYINRHSPLPEFSGICLGLTSYVISHIHCIHKISTHCESFDVFWGLISGQKFSHIYYTERVSPPCEFSDDH